MAIVIELTLKEMVDLGPSMTTEELIKLLGKDRIKDIKEKEENSG